MVAVVLSFTFHPVTSSAGSRFDEFVEWAEPGGVGGFNYVHVARYDAKDPFFTYSPRFIPHSHNSARSFLIKQEWENKGSTTSFYTRARGEAVPVVLRPHVMIAAGRYLRFAKAYLNVYTALRDLSSPSKSTVRALIYLEKALRDLNDGDNDPANLCHLSFKRAALLIQRSALVASVKFDTAKALEHMAKLLQGGGKFKGDKNNKLLPAFNLIKLPFVFNSPIKSPPKFGKAAAAVQPDPELNKELEERNLTSEEVAAVGMAYRRSHHRFGADGVPTFYAAVVGLPLTTASMRASELQSLRVDAFYYDGDRPRLRIPRPKIGVEQDVPIPKRLGSLAQELSDVIKGHSAEARKALAYYINQSPTSHQDVRTLYIPDALKDFFKKTFLSVDDVQEGLYPHTKLAHFPKILEHLERTRFVKKPGDLYGTTCHALTVPLRDVIRASKASGIPLSLPPDIELHQYISKADMSRFSGRFHTPAGQKAFGPLFTSDNAVKPRLFLRSADLQEYLLAEFKTLSFPHWPFADKNRSVRLDMALALHFRPNSDTNVEPGAQRPLWWLPCLLSIQALNRWISGDSRYQPLLFTLTDVKLDDGSYPRISIHQTRRHHHTSALVAGVNPLLLNQLAGRESGWQAEAYDCRTPSQVLKQSIETFDPDEDFDVIGPIAEQAPPKVKVIERKAFLMQNAAPKHIHETGGCSADWSLDPCHRFGDCMRCELHLWRKGDVARLPRIRDIHSEASRIVWIGQNKLLKNPRLVSVANHVRQAKEMLDRCEQIFHVESDDAVAVGTIVTFNAAPSAMSDAELLSWLRKRPRPSQSVGGHA